MTVAVEASIVPINNSLRFAVVEAAIVPINQINPAIIVQVGKGNCSRSNGTFAYNFIG